MSTLRSDPAQISPAEGTDLRPMVMRHVVEHAIRIRDARSLQTLLRSRFFEKKADAIGSAGVTSDILSILNACPSVLPPSEVPLAWAQWVRHGQDTTGLERLLQRAYRGIMPASHDLTAHATGAGAFSRIRLALIAVSADGQVGPPVPEIEPSVLQEEAILPAALATVARVRHGRDAAAEAVCLAGFHRSVSLLLASRHPSIGAAGRAECIRATLQAARAAGPATEVKTLRLLTGELPSARQAVISQVAEIVRQFHADALLGLLLGAATRLYQDIMPREESRLSELADAAEERVNSCRRSSVLPEALARSATLLAVAGHTERGIASLVRCLRSSNRGPHPAAAGALACLAESIDLPEVVLAEGREWGLLTGLIHHAVANDADAFRKASAAIVTTAASADEEVKMLLVEAVRELLATGRIPVFEEDLERSWATMLSTLPVPARLAHLRARWLELPAMSSNNRFSAVEAHVRSGDDKSQIAFLYEMHLDGSPLFPRLAERLLPAISRSESTPAQLVEQLSTVTVFARSLGAAVEPLGSRAVMAWDDCAGDRALSYLEGWLRKDVNRRESVPWRTCIASVALLPASDRAAALERIIHLIPQRDLPALLEGLTLAERRRPGIVTAIPPGWLEGLTLGGNWPQTAHVAFEARRLELLVSQGPSARWRSALDAMHDLCVRQPDAVLEARWELFPSPDVVLAHAWLELVEPDLAKPQYVDARRSAIALVSGHLAVALTEPSDTERWSRPLFLSLMNSGHEHKQLSLALLAAVPAFRDVLVHLGGTAETVVEFVERSVRQAGFDEGPGRVRFAAEAADIWTRSGSTAMADIVLRTAAENARKSYIGSRDIHILAFALLRLVERMGGFPSAAVNAVRELVTRNPRCEDVVALLDAASGARTWRDVVAEMSLESLDLWSRRYSLALTGLDEDAVGSLFRRAMFVNHAVDRVAATICLQSGGNIAAALVRLLIPGERGRGPS